MSTTKDTSEKKPDFSYTYDFIRSYDGAGAYGLNREMDEETLMYYLQSFAEDKFLKTLIPRLSDGDLEEIYIVILRNLKKYLSEDEYHTLFLKEEHEH